MDIIRAKEVISALAEGIDPTTGEVLPDNSVCNKGEVVRALYAILDSLDKKKAAKRAPENAGKPWSTEDETTLVSLYRSGASTRDICNTFKRTPTGIAARLVRLGIIENRDIFLDRK